MTIEQLLAVLQQGGLLGGVTLFLWAGLTERVVWGWTYRRALKDRDTAHEAEKAILLRQNEILVREREALWQFALKQVGISDRALDVGSRGVNAAATLAHRSQEADG